MNTNKKILETVELAVLVALVVTLQLVSAIVPPIGGMVSITLTLVPVVVGAILFGIKGGVVLGTAFGAIVLINCIIPLDPGGNILWNANPLMTALLCFVKGIAAGLIPAVLYSACRGKKERVGKGRKLLSTLIAAMFAPIANTGLFICGMAIFFMDTLSAWAGGSNIVTYVLFGLAGVNFLIEFLINIILAPTIVRIVDIIKKK